MGVNTQGVPNKAPDARKRKNPPPSSTPSGGGQDGNERPSGRDFKRVKMRDARAIQSQSAAAALNDGELDLQSFLNAQEFQIKALEDGMRKSKAMNNRRAFQLVPRSMRRRTASHNVKKVPKRLRRRAAQEMATDNTPTVDPRRRKPRTTRARIRVETAKRLGIIAEKQRKKRLKQAANGKATDVEGGAQAAIKQLIDTRPARPKIRRNVLNDPPKSKAKFRKRQISKTWLPTHLWHAKRARMTEPKEPLWRFAIPLTPTEKCYRPTHRASGERGAAAWDMSYMSTIGLYGSAASIERTLRAVGLIYESMWDDRGRKWRDGSRKWSGLLSKEKDGLRRDIGPATVFWNTESSIDPSEEDAPAPKRTQRQVYIRVHPSCFLELFTLLTKLVKRENPQVYVEDLRFEIGSIEITGPASTEALLGVLRPYFSGEEDKEAHADLFKSLLGVGNPAALPPDVLLAFSAQDPRLSYPPRKAQTTDSATPEASISLAETLVKWPADKNPKPYALFDRNARFKASCLPSQKALNRRKSSNPVGEPLPVTVADPPIPLILFASRSPSGRQAQGTWTLLAPWKCIQPIWYSLMHAPLSSGGNPRFGGLDETRQVAFEQRQLWFPADFLGTDAGAEWELEQRQKRQREWDRRPKSKRVAWESLDLGAGRKGEIGSGVACDFEHIFGLKEPEGAPDGSQEKEPRVVIDADDMDVDMPPTTASDTQQKQETNKKQSPHPIYSLRCLTKTSFTTLTTPRNTSLPPPRSLITIHITYLSRGVPKPCARIYRLPSTSSPTITALPSTQAEVPSTEPPSDNTTTTTTTLPSNLREQWLAQVPKQILSPKSANPSPPPQPKRPLLPPDADADTRKRLLAASLLTATELPYPRPKANEADMGGHPLVPDERDLIGFVTTGSFSLAEGRGVAVGCVSAEKAVEALRVDRGSSREGRICIVRNAGESVGWIARWEVV